jgi:hypothetical protein
LYIKTSALFCRMAQVNKRGRPAPASQRCGGLLLTSPEDAVGGVKILPLSICWSHSERT